MFYRYSYPLGNTHEFEYCCATVYQNNAVKKDVPEADLLVESNPESERVVHCERERSPHALPAQQRRPSAHPVRDRLEREATHLVLATRHGASGQQVIPLREWNMIGTE